MESGSATSRDCRPYDSEIVERYFAEFLNETGCPPTLSTADTFTYLRELPLSRITDAQQAVFNKYRHTMQWAFRPVIDGDIIPRPPMESWRSKNFYKVPIMTGFCTNEGSLFVDRKLSEPKQFIDFVRRLLPGLPEEDIAEIDRLYPDPSTGNTVYLDGRVGSEIGAQFMRTEAVYGQYSLIAPIRQTAHLASSIPTSPPVYLYHWDVFATLHFGAAHGDSMRYETMDRVTTSLSPAQKEVASVLHAYMTSFICHQGDPNRLQGRMKDRPIWKPYTPAQPLTMILGNGNRELIGGPVGTPAELTEDTWAIEQCQFWWDRVDITRL